MVLEGESFQGPASADRSVSSAQASLNARLASYLKRFLREGWLAWGKAPLRRRDFPLTGQALRGCVASR